MPNILLTVAARGGSKSVKDKNIREVKGRPLISYTLMQAKKWGKAKRIVCTTDSSAIADLAKKWGAEVPFRRPAALGADHVGKIPVLRHALKESEAFYKETFDIVVDLDVTSPLRKISDLDHCLKLFLDKKPKTLFSVVAARRNPYFNMVEEDTDGRVSICKLLSSRVLRRQDAPKVYDMNASIYFYDRDYLSDERHVTAISDNSIVYVMDEVSCLDVDSELDFKLVEFLLTQKEVIDEQLFA